MFTGIIEEVGRFEGKFSGKNDSIKVSAKKVLEDAKLGDSIAVNGVCLTITKISGNTLSFDVMAATLQDTTLGFLKKGEPVNLERALSAKDRLGGHFVSGHVDTVGQIQRIVKAPNLYKIFVTVSEAKRYGKLFTQKGSIAIDGISLTIQDKQDNVFSVGIIPHTFQQTRLKNLKAGDKVNLEFDLLARYIENILSETKKENSIKLRKYLAR